ncbi:1-deoxy-D-xylulose 5-phosphate reductoisomerase [Thermodesulfitimonas autotrophica]|uniref:1-deoxy-D-xylulose 5-phosphate reductoisomerase n=1 Tax=Thermodesulfitimonas autotrophica TaxID=1894989 RepID=A0A3N5BPZ3_9THEO|nr:1-deoxy-D-xylulose-5-phosphate reductoisomerase [Thermodesulfitimonas autotrophica]RPF49692.1 1-deoxy-D-xylulose 5-phosphate reductoisomerase [Thermodesulfitimonas autotrophica]
MARGIAILGSTGSIGRQTLAIVQEFPERFVVRGLAAGRNWELLLEQTCRFRPQAVALLEKEDALRLKAALPPGVKTAVYWGHEGLLQVATLPDAAIVLTAVTGAAGLEPTLAAIEAGKDIALANKETLVAAGEIVVRRVREKGVRLLPVDSEHSAVWQCLDGRGGVAGIILTASGGPFRELNPEALARVTPDQALKHPTWQMGPKITVDSATLMNKGLEVIEAHWLFGVSYDNIRVLVHPQSIVHGMVEFADGNLVACLSITDMRLPILYALSYPERLANSLPRLDLAAVGRLSFEEPDTERFPALRLAYAAGKTGGTMPAVLNAANEVAVAAFLAGELPFTGIPEVVERVMARHKVEEKPELPAILSADQWARAAAAEVVRARHC